MSDSLSHEAAAGKPSRSPSGWRRRALIAVLAVPPAVMSIYMGLYQIRAIESVWDPVFGAQTLAVLDSNVSHAIRDLFRIPDAFLGAMIYIADIVLAVVGSQQRWYQKPWLVILFALAIVPGAVVSLFLVVMQATVVQAWCFLCLLTALFSVILVILAYPEVRASIGYLGSVWARFHAAMPVWKAAWGHEIHG